jgi:hypothetical protein
MKKSTMTTKKKLRKQHNLPSWISSSEEALLVPVVEALVPVVENLRRLQASS